MLLLGHRQRLLWKHLQLMQQVLQHRGNVVGAGLLLLLLLRQQLLVRRWWPC
jgi:hypothetical protein